MNSGSSRTDPDRSVCNYIGAIERAERTPAFSMAAMFPSRQPGNGISSS